MDYCLPSQFNRDGRVARGCPTRYRREVQMEVGVRAMSQLIALISPFRSGEEGQGLAEYALILALIAIVAIIALMFLGNSVSQILSTVGDSL